MTVRVVFTDGSVKDFSVCDDFKANREYQCFFVERQGHLIMLPFANVKYIGYKVDVE